MPTPAPTLEAIVRLEHMYGNDIAAMVEACRESAVRFQQLTDLLEEAIKQGMILRNGKIIDGESDGL